MTSSHTAEPLLDIRDLRKEFPGQPPSVAVDDVSLTVTEGETFALVGESGCGKTTLTRLLLRLLPPTSGSVRFDGTDLLSLDHAALRPFRRQMQVVLQDPYSSMNPRLRIARVLTYVDARRHEVRRIRRAHRRGRGPRRRSR
ncbi:ATP-binding cassette domain-containing protein, partial [Streptomyces sp. NPDC005349]|uniref:ATP-binding cassette domain-containing protein n=1 Tax=Streptomyces sp. NPDC005349 TaxID=3157037 RepID=UPI0033AECBF3